MSKIMTVLYKICVVVLLAYIAIKPYPEPTFPPVQRVYVDNPSSFTWPNDPIKVTIANSTAMPVSVVGSIPLKVNVQGSVPITNVVGEIDGKLLSIPLAIEGKVQVENYRFGGIEMPLRIRQ